MLLVSLVVNLAQAQRSTVTGDVIGHARALQQDVAGALPLAVAGSANVLVPALQVYLSPESVPQTARVAFSIWDGLARFVVAVVLGGAGVLTSVCVVFAGLGTQAGHLLESLVVLARPISRPAILLVGGILALSPFLISNWVVSFLY
jgi:hypothetical protein